VQAVGQLDQDDADVLRHRHDHLAVVLGLCVLAALEVDPRQLRDAVDELRDLVAELRPQLLELDLGVLDDVVQERSCDRLLVEPELGGDLRDPEGVVDEVFAAAALLPLVRALCEAEGVRDQLAVQLGQVALGLGDQLIDEVLVFLRCLDDRHGPSVLRAFGVTVPAAGAGGTSRTGAKTVFPCAFAVAPGRAGSMSSHVCSSSSTAPRPTAAIGCAAPAQVACRCSA
jgi:hypothetical protein